MGYQPSEQIGKTITPQHRVGKQRSGHFTLHLHRLKSQETLCVLFSTIWCQDTVRYLGFKITRNLEDLIKVTLIPLLKHVQKQLDSWNKLRLSWYVYIAVLKMKVLLKF